jgi:hypothetical protein
MIHGPHHRICRLPPILTFNFKSLLIVPKEIKTATNPPKTCLDLGFHAIYVGNNSGCVLDGVTMLVGIHKNALEVFGKMAVYVDEGVSRGNGFIARLRLWVLDEG